MMTDSTPDRARSLRVRVAAVSDVGRSRDHNEDSFLLWNVHGRQALNDTGRTDPHLSGDASLEAEGVFRDCDGVIMAVCDGMGGAAAGERASSIAIRTLAGQAAELQNDMLRKPDHIVDWLAGIVTEADRHILTEAESDSELEGMGSTMTVAAVLPGALSLAHVGDSRAYHLRDERLRQLTVDHSFVAELVAMGRISPNEARTHENRNLLMQALGLGRPLDVDRLSVSLQSGDRVLLCSDGLYDLVSDEELEQGMLGMDDPADLCRKLVARANERGGTDNITVIVALVE